jgi:hypothetical protein
MKSKIILYLALVLIGGLFGCSTINQSQNWPVFYDCEKGPTHLSILREPQTLDSYTNGISDWNYDLRIPAAKINSAEIKNLGQVDGLLVIEVRLVLTDAYYTDAVMILEEVESGLFLPVYVQDYNRYTRSPSESVITKGEKKLIINTGMDYEGAGHFHNHYKITISPNHNPAVTGSFY